MDQQREDAKGTNQIGLGVLGPGIIGSDIPAPGILGLGILESANLGLGPLVLEIFELGFLGTLYGLL